MYWCLVTSSENVLQLKMFIYIKIIHSISNNFVCEKEKRCLHFKSYWSGLRAWISKNHYVWKNFLLAKIVISFVYLAILIQVWYLLSFQCWYLYTLNIKKCIYRVKVFKTSVESGDILCVLDAIHTDLGKQVYPFFFITINYGASKNIGLHNTFSKLKYLKNLIFNVKLQTKF